MDDSVDDGPTRCGTFVYYTWKVCTCLFSHVLLVTMVITYCIIGAYTFEHLEATNEGEVKRNISKIRNNVTADLWRITDMSLVLDSENWTIEVKQRLEQFEKDLVRSMKVDGWDGNEDEKKKQWTWTGSLFYSIIVITTIGYGHIAPKTHWGKVVTILYAILGIPLMLLCLSNIGDIMAHSFRFLYWRVCCYVCTRRPKRPPPPPLRRGRSVRNTLRSQSGYFEEGDQPGLHRGNRASQHSRFSDTVLQVPHSTPTPSTPQGAGSGEFPQGFDAASAARAPVLFNPYALEREATGKQQPPRRGALPSPLTPPTPPPVDLMPSPRESFRSHRSPPQSPSRPRVMTPMGFAISRQTSHRSRSSRMSRVREDAVFDDYPYDDYEYEESYGSQHSITKPVPIWLCVFLVVTYIFCGAYLFHHWEKWEFLDAAYFCFITLTTIGFGDFVPAQHENEENDGRISIALCSLYLLFGIALLAMSFNLVQEEVIGNVKAVAKRLGIIKDDEDEDAD